MFAACIGTNIEVVSHQEPCLELPTTPGTPRHGLSRVRTASILSQSSLVPRGADLLINVGSMSPRRSGPMSPGLRTSSGRAADAFRRLPSVRRGSMGGAVPPPAPRGSRGDDVDDGEQQQPGRQRRRIARRQRRSSGSWGEGMEVDTTVAVPREASSALPARVSPACAPSPFGAVGSDGLSIAAALASGECPGGFDWDDFIATDDDEGEAAADDGSRASDASSLPPIKREGSTLQWTASRKQLEENLEAAALESQAHPEPDMLSGDDRLAARLAGLGLVEELAVADGNCQFRSISQQLYGTAHYHLALRHTAVRHMRANSDFFACYLGDEFESYLEGMERNGTWGDELTLRALSDALYMRVVVISSEQHNWLLRYEPEADLPRLEVFLAYDSPVHYNSLRRKLIASAAQRLISNLKRTASRRNVGAPAVVPAPTGV